eukprot:TRINITY_DN23205_c0_g2_i1.p1 TRINITY_DN23205_c0_g2~~TRINITY_DN23205_c0_g2_i1.p1  ORF type:complete len:251 (-),score=37.63 TRINITY_DN23205_c0_g2_i1:153-839(-)
MATRCMSSCAVSTVALVFILLRGGLVRGSTCTPKSASMFYQSAYILPDAVGTVSGWDASDPRYVVPETGEPYGGYATEVYASGGAKLYIGSKHIAHTDTVYRSCLGINALVDVSMKHLHSEDKYPHWQPYPVVDTFGGLTRRRLPESLFWKFRTEIATFIDAQLAAGNGVIIYEHEETCNGAAAMAIAYLMQKAMTFQAAYDLLVARRPCISQMLEQSQFMDYLQPSR